MLEKVLRELRNWFESDTRITQDFHVVGGSITLPLEDGRYFRIDGSKFNDGLHRYGEDDLDDEDFHGTVTALNIPRAVIDIAEDVEAWVAANDEAARSPFNSESFGGYSYSKKVSEGGGSYSWQDAFESELNSYRKCC